MRSSRFRRRRYSDVEIDLRVTIRRYRDVSGFDVLVDVIVKGELLVWLSFECELDPYGCVDGDYALRGERNDLVFSEKIDDSGSVTNRINLNFIQKKIMSSVIVDETNLYIWIPKASNKHIGIYRFRFRFIALGT